MLAHVFEHDDTCMFRAVFRIYFLYSEQEDRENRKQLNTHTYISKQYLMEMSEWHQ